MAPKMKATSSANGSAKGKATPIPSTNGTTTPVDKKDTSEALAALLGGGGKPDKKLYDAEQDRIKAEIDAVSVTLSALRDKISLSSKGAGNDRRSALIAELDTIRSQQAGSKASRSEIVAQNKALNEQIQKKLKDLNASRSKVPFKTVAEVDAHIKQLEKQVDSGTLRLVDEKRALSDISQCKRQRKTVEAFAAEEEVINELRQKYEESKKDLNDPAAKALSEKYESIQAELDELKKEANEAYQNRSKLFAEREVIQAQLDVLHTERRELTRQFKEANDRHWNKIHEDRARRAERAKAQRAAEEAEKKKEIADRLLEEAQIPAFQVQIEDCQTLIDSFSGKNTDNATLKSVPSEKAEVVGVPKLDIRKVEAPSEGLVARKKKGDDEESYFVGKGKSKGGKKGKSNGSSEPATPTSNSLNVPLATLSALLALSIPPPTSSSDVPRVIEDLKTKKAWFEANQKRVTAENIAKAEAEIQRLTNGSSKSARVDEPSSPAQDTIPPNGTGEAPPEPAPTPAVGDAESAAVSSEEVVDKLEVVQEQEAS
ncbi:Nuclear segregation protein Bfr1 [Pleurotus pulmonarius]